MNTHVKILEWAEYPVDSRFPCTPIIIEHPSWTQIEVAIRRLDKHSHPWVVLAPVIKESERFDGNSDSFEIIGGGGDYWIAGSMQGYWQRCAINPNGGEDEIELWTSDQGLAAPSRTVLHDLATAINAAKYYYEHNDFFPGLEWDNQTPTQG